jgi:hypothetical protein
LVQPILDDSGGWRHAPNLTNIVDLTDISEKAAEAL